MKCVSSWFPKREIGGMHKGAGSRGRGRRRGEGRVDVLYAEFCESSTGQSAVATLAAVCFVPMSPSILKPTMRRKETAGIEV